MFLQVYQRLYAAFGAQHWWPGESPFEVMVGAVLTQNTAWSNVEKAIANLRACGLLYGPSMLLTEPERLATQIRSAGYFNLKAERLLALCRFLEAREALDDPLRLRERGDARLLRQDLLAVRGIGPETADSILLYALDLPIFVVDAYTRRIFERLGLLQGGETYAEIQALFHAHCAADVAFYNEYHALIVMLGKSVCRPQPHCQRCPLGMDCAFNGHGARATPK